MPRRKHTPSMIDLLLDAPWQASVVAGVVAYAALKWLLPSISADNMFLGPLSLALSETAVWFAGAFFLIGFLVFIKTTANKEKRARPVEPVMGVPVQDGLGRVEPAERSSQSVEAEPAAFVDRPAVWSLALIRALEWKRFEDVCQQFYEKKGIRSETTPLGPDGGIDIRLFQDESGRPTSIVQCKAWGERLVGVKPVRELLGVMTHEKIGKAFFMTSGSYTDEAKAVAQANRITLIDGSMLLMMIERLPEGERQDLLTFATAGDYATPTCPSCGIKMRAVQGKGGRPDFWGCHHYPRCRQVLGMRRNVEAAASGTAR